MLNMILIILKSSSTLGLPILYIDRPIDDSALANAVKEGLLELSKAKVSIIAMPCNTAHKYFDQLEKSRDGDISEIRSY